MSGFLLDTNVISELIKVHIEPRVAAWVEATDEDLLYLSVLTLGEIRKGAAFLPRSSRRVGIENWLETGIKPRFSGRILPVDEAISERWGLISGKAAAQGIVVPVVDGLLAATALHHNLTLVTRNVKDVVATGAVLFNPWESR